MSTQPDEREYGGHQFNESGVCDCNCWLNKHGSGGPPGLDPKGECPKNPKNGKIISFRVDLENVARRRIEKLNSQIHNLEEANRKLREELKMAKAVAGILTREAIKTEGEGYRK